MKFYLVSIICFWLISYQLSAEVLLDGYTYQASLVAYEDLVFHKHANNFQKYKIHFKDSADSVSVTFVPQHETGKTSLRGGGNVYGREVRYEISKEEMKIIKKSFAR